MLALCGLQRGRFVQVPIEIATSTLSLLLPTEMVEALLELSLWPLHVVRELGAGPAILGSADELGHALFFALPGDDLASLRHQLLDAVQIPVDLLEVFLHPLDNPLLVLGQPLPGDPADVEGVLRARVVL